MKALIYHGPEYIDLAKSLQDSYIMHCDQLEIIEERKGVSI